MLLEVTTKQGKTYTVDDDDVYLWVCVEQDLGLTYAEAAEKMSNTSMVVITYVLHYLSLYNGHTELKTVKAWVQNELDTFKVVEDHPKEPAA